MRRTKYRKQKRRNKRKTRKHPKRFKGGAIVSLDIAIDLWREKTYEIIQDYLKNRGTQLEGTPAFISYGGKDYPTAKIISALQSAMRPIGEWLPDVENHVFYRGDKNPFLTNASYNKNTFISISTDMERATEYMNHHNIVYTIQVRRDTRCLKTGIENEYLIDVDSCWQNQGGLNVLITPHNDELPYYNELIAQMMQTSEAPVYQVNAVQTPINTNTGSTVVTVDNIEHFLDQFNIYEEESYTFDDFKNDLNTMMVGYTYEPGTERELWTKYEKVKE